MLKASDVKPFVVFISPPSYDRILTLRRGKVDPFNPRPTAQMSVSTLNMLLLPAGSSKKSIIYTLRSSGRPGGLMVSALDSGANWPGV